ncbi:hypothetical protein CYMTET_13904 [Cymbomonas tetramitiformis]|uniref:CTLH domain-containing protein n=1 Tax=Cymbomonas tetramitiformis TaxID=36881 RepID=A0AAE0GHH1_9CHLO|nr:hypothetical protein CYMTET_13904 [Cymbomonas tetramitiformis]
MAFKEDCLKFTYNESTLDTLALDYVQQEQLVQGNDGCKSTKTVRDECCKVKNLVLKGQIQHAMEASNSVNSAILEDPRLYFRLQRQRFIELLRAAGDDDDALMRAVECARKDLAPCALDAYPEAYSEFQRSMLLLLYSKDKTDSPVSGEWSEGARYELGAMFALTLRQAMGAYDPQLSLLLRYLITTHKIFCTTLGADSPATELAEHLLPVGRDPPPLPRENVLGSFQEAKIQALVQAVGLPRQDAIESLKHTEGNIETAFMNELSRMRLNHALLDELVQEYACYRGLLDPDSGEASSASDAEVAEGDEGSGKRCMLKWVGRRAEDLALQGCGTSQSSELPVGRNARPACEQYGRVMAMRAAVLAGQTDEVLRKLEVEEPGLLEASPQLLFDLKREQFMGMVAAGEAPRALQLAREELGPLSLKHPDLVPALKSTLVSIAQPALAPQAAEGKHAHELATTLQQALSKRLGLAEPRLIVLLRSLLHAHTEWFKLQRCEDPFRHMCSLHLLKAPSAAAALPTHSLRGDPLSGALVFTTESISPIATAHPGRSVVDEGRAPGSHHIVDDSDEEDEEEEMRTSMDGVLNEFTFSEDTILTLMEFMALSRADAIQLLQQHDGSVDTVIANLLT